jgi:tRNA G10  N-methylase Trm11
MNHVRRTTQLAALGIPGLAPLMTRELGQLPGVAVQGTGHDGRSDVVLVQTQPKARDQVLQARLAEDVLVEVAHATRTQTQNRAASLAQALWPAEGSQAALSVWAGQHRPLRAAETVRVVVRVLTEQAFLRTDLRTAIQHAIQRERPRWRLADPASLEIWVLEYAPGQFLSGLRLSDAKMRSHGGREVERTGALRPTAAAAMIDLAGEPSGLLLDPCCGSGTILAQAHTAGWSAQGSDIDPDAVRVAQANVPYVSVTAADVRHLDLPDHSVTAVVSNLPFGQKFTRQGNPTRWMQDALRELTRVVRPEGRVVLLAPSIPEVSNPGCLHLQEKHRLRLLGTPTTLWVFSRD